MSANKLIAMAILLTAALVSAGARVGAGSDAGDFAVLNPWLNIYYNVTGKDVTGALVYDGEQVTREQAVKLYSADNGWFIREEDSIGSIESGKLGDVAVLSADFFDPKKVSDEDIKKMKSVLTVVGGKAVYDDLHRTAAHTRVWACLNL